jgi:predicted aldo/keto reductase-like oxidoreductase
MNRFFPEIKKNFGFGLMRLPMIGEDVDIEQTKSMVDAFLAAGFNYFDTAKPYIQGKSELAVKECLSSRYPRESYILTNKLSFWCFEKEEDIRPLFQSQLDACGVEYFDFYLHHALSGERHETYTKLRAYDVVKELKEEGKIRHIGMSFHDTADVLDKILTDRPEIEAVQLQLNYVDWIDPRVQAEKCYEVCVKHGKPVIVMEPVKGGSLVNLPQEAADLLTDYSQAGYALRFAASPENVFMVLSGMSNTEQMEDNLKTMGDFKPFAPGEYETIDKVRTIFQGQNRVPCTGCRYCVDGCPAGIPIPDVFTAFKYFKSRKEDISAQGKAAYEAIENKADQCVGCGQCEEACPQFLHIRELLEAISKAF